MPVNANKSGSRLLAVIEQIARSQPIGVRALARILETEKSAVQRAVTTLAEAGWIQSPAGLAGAWELTGRILHVAHMAYGSNSLRQRVRPVLDSLRDQTGETLYLAIPDVDNLVVMEVAESRQALRLVMPVGTILPAVDSAAGRAILPHLPSGKQADILGKLDLARQEQLRLTGEHGYVLFDEPDDGSAISIAVPIFNEQAQPIGALVLYAVRPRLPIDDFEKIGRLLAGKAREISNFGQTEVRLSDLRHAIGGFG